VTIDALAAGKDVYCEKPIAARYADGVAMVEAAEQYGKKLHIQITPLFSIESRAARAMVEDGLLGDVYHGRAWVNQRRSRPFVDGYGTASFVSKKTAGGGALIDWGIYAISQVLFVMGNPKPERVSGATYNKMWMDEARRKESGYDVEELGLGFVRMEGGTTMDVMTAWALNLGRGLGCAVAGSKGGVQLPAINGPKDIGLKFYHTDRDYEFESDLNTGALARRWKNVSGQGDIYESSQHHWVRALQGRVELLPTAEIALNMILIAEGIYLSSELNREVTAEEILKTSQEA
jgi:predicted dehydrogenase